MGVQLFANGAAATLSGTLAQGGTTMTLAAGTGAKFPSIAGGEYFYVTLFTKDAFAVEQNIEVVQVTARTGDTLTLVRDIETMTGQSGGFAYDGNATTVYVQQRNTAKTMDNMLQKSGNLSGLADNAAARTNIGLGNVTNTSDANKPISTAQQTALDAKAPTAAPIITGDLTLSSVGARIRGDFSNATLANRVAFQSSTVNGGTYVTALPNGTASVAAVQAFNSSDPANTSYMSLSVTPTHVRLNSNVLGTGTQLPLALATSNVDRQTILPTGEVGIGVTPSVGKGTLQVPDINGAATSGFRNKIINGCMRISKRGGGAAVLGGNLLGADGIFTHIGGWSAITGSISTEQQIAPTRTSSGSTHYVTINTASGSTGYIQPYCRIEAADSAELANKPVTVSVRVTAGAKQIDQCYMRVYKANSINNFGAQTLVSHGADYGVIATSTTIDYTHTFTCAGADAVTGLQIDVVVEYQSAVSGTFDVIFADLQCCAGSQRMPFELRPIAIEEQLRRRYYRKQAVWVGTSTARTVMPIDMFGTPTTTGGGTGYVSTGTDKDTLVCYQTTAGLQTLVLNSEL